MSCTWDETRQQFLMDCRPMGRNAKRVRMWLPKAINTQAKADDFEKLYKNSFKSADPYRERRTDYTIKGMWPEYLSYITTNRSRNTATDVEIAGRHLSRHIGEFVVTDLNSGVFELYKKLRLEDYVPSRRKPDSRSKKTPSAPKKISHRTVNKELVWLSGMLTYYREVVKLADVPRIEWERLPHTRPIPIVLSKPEIVSLLAVADTPFWRALFGFMVLCGLRSEEVKSLKWSNVDESNGRIVVYGKGGKFRTVPVRDWLFDQLRYIPRLGPYVFTNPNTEERVVNITGTLERAARKAGITKHVNPHLLRHTYATHAVSEISLRELQWLLGHSQVETTTFYTHVNDQNLAAAASKVLTGLELPEEGLVRAKALPKAGLSTPHRRKLLKS